MTFVEISTAIMDGLRPNKKLVIAERTQFLSIIQKEAETVLDYVHRLREASRFCAFEEMGKNGQSIENDMLQMRLIDGMRVKHHKAKLLEYLQTVPDAKFEECIRQVQQL